MPIYLDAGAQRLLTEGRNAYRRLSLAKTTSLRTTTRHRVVAVVLADPERVLGRIGSWKARGARLDLRYYGSPLALADQMLDHSAEEIAAAVQALTTVSVRRFDG
jgi:hypothetical protein